MKGIKYLNPRLLTVLTGATLLAQLGVAQVPFSSGIYLQTFNTLANTGTPTWTDNSTLLGWYAAKSVAPTAIVGYTPGTGSGNAGVLYSFGSASSTERALGAVTSSGSGNIAFGVRFLNDTPQPITDIIVSCTGEEWRTANATAQTLTFSYRVGNTLDADVANANTWTSVAALNFTSPVNSATATALDGNVAANRQVIAGVPLNGVQVAPGQEIFFRWFETKGSGSMDGLAIDDLTVSFSGGTTVNNPPTIGDNGQPQNRTNNAGTTATFTVTPDGTPPFTYRWWKGNTSLSNGGNISGATNSTLTLTNVLTADAGSYFVGVTNSAGGTASAVAVLTIKDPAILAQTSSRTYFSGETALLSVSVAGTPTLGYQWYKDDAPLSNGGTISGATASTLAVGPLAATDAGLYQVIVTNALGAATSAVAVVSIHVVPSARIALWDFNDTNAPVASPAPSVGSGVASLLNGVSTAYAAGSSRDFGLTNQAWNTTKYPASTESNKTAGVQFKVSTLGYTNIMVTWEQNNSNTGSKYARLQYSLDGENFVDLDVISATGSFAYYSHDFTGLQTVEDNTNFTFRIVTEFASTAIGGAENYVPTSGTSYGSTGTLRFDLVNVFGEPNGSVVLPIPLHIQQVANKVVLTWSDSTFALQSAPAAVGVFTNVPGAASPHTNQIGSGPQFFRLKH